LGQGEEATGGGAEAGARLGRLRPGLQILADAPEERVANLSLSRFRAVLISASSFGSTQMPLCATRFLKACVFRTNGSSASAAALRV
jgi:hypothetical protein